jgi:hypothetical protein
MKVWKDRDEKLEYLEYANKILSASINVDSDRNWFAYTTRMHVRLDIADIVIKHNPKKAKSSILGDMPCLKLLEDCLNTA